MLVWRGPVESTSRRRLPSLRTALIAAAVVALIALLVVLYVVAEPDLSKERVLRLFREYGYPVVFVPVFLETAGIPLPGETTLLLGGLAASQPETHLNVVLVIVVGAVAAILGDNVGFAVGRYGGRRLVLKLAHIGGVERSLSWGERFFAQHGGKTVFFARWLPGLRIFGAWIAGMVHMPWWRFALWNALGGICWATSVVLAGYFFGRSLDAIEKVLGVGGVVAVVLLGVAALGWYLLHERRKRQEMEREGLDEPR
jgi:membrane protein DedA with SNARE-associated domain